MMLFGFLLGAMVFAPAGFLLAAILAVGDTPTPPAREFDRERRLRVVSGE